MYENTMDMIGSGKHFFSRLLLEYKRQLKLTPLDILDPILNTYDS